MELAKGILSLLPHAHLTGVMQAPRKTLHPQTHYRRRLTIKPQVGLGEVMRAPRKILHAQTHSSYLTIQTKVGLSLGMRARWWEMAKIPNHGTIVKEEHWIKKSGAGGHIWRKMMWRISKDALEVLVVASSVIKIVVTAVAAVPNFLVTQQQTSFILLQCLLLITEKGTECVWNATTF